MRGGSQYEKTMFGGSKHHLGRGTRLSGPGNVSEEEIAAEYLERTGDSGKETKTET